MAVSFAAPRCGRPPSPLANSASVPLPGKERRCHGLMSSSPGRVWKAPSWMTGTQAPWIAKTMKEDERFLQQKQFYAILFNSFHVILRPRPIGHPTGAVYVFLGHRAQVPGAGQIPGVRESDCHGVATGLDGILRADLRCAHPSPE